MSYTGKSNPNQYGAGLAYNSLLSTKTGADLKYEQVILTPALAERWEVQDAATYTFHLRKSVKFANLPPINGRELTAEDVKWSYEYWSRTGQFAEKKLPQARFNWFFEGVTDIQTPDSSTVVVRFKDPFVPFINYAGSYNNPIVAHEIFDQYGNFKDHIVGTGPFQLDETSVQKGSRWSWKKNPDYWDAGRPYLDEVRWLIIPDDAAAIAAFEAKQVDIIGATGDVFGLPQTQQIPKAYASAVQDEHLPTGPTLWLDINNQTPPLNDVRVRQALSLAIDRDEFIKTFAGGKGAWALPGAGPDTFTQAEIQQLLHYDPNQAKQLLSEAGYPNGVDLDFTYPGAAYGQDYISHLQLLQAQAKKVGINIQLRSQDKNTWSSLEMTGKYLITANPKTSAMPGGDIDAYVYANFHSGTGENRYGVKDAQLDKMLEAQRREPDAAKRNELVREAVRYVTQQAYGIAVFRAAQCQFWQPSLKGYTPNAWSVTVPQANSWIES
jgi:peptide/nickel transport system substrate-binding protein